MNTIYCCEILPHKLLCQVASPFRTCTSQVLAADWSDLQGGLQLIATSSRLCSQNLVASRIYLEPIHNFIAICPLRRSIRSPSTSEARALCAVLAANIVAVAATLRTNCNESVSPVGNFRPNTVDSFLCSNLPHAREMARIFLLHYCHCSLYPQF